MKKMHKIVFLVLFTIIASYGHAAAGGLNKPTPKNNDSLINTKSNIFIFKMITTPVSSTNPTSGSLKQAGKVARTSAPHPITYTPPIHWVKPYS